MSEREWYFYIDDMIDFAQQVANYTTGLSQEAFFANRMVHDATLRNMELIGEAATHVPDEVRKTFADIPWRQIIATRNRLIHGYLGIDADTVWSIVQSDIPALLPALQTLRSTNK